MVRKMKVSLKSLISMGLIASLGCGLAGCNYPDSAAASATATLPPANTPTATTAPSEPPLPSNTPQPTETPSPSATAGPSDTPTATATPPIEIVGVVVLNGQDIGVIQKSGDQFSYLADALKLTPEVEGKVVLQIKDPGLTWGFNLENSSSTMYTLKDDPRNGWEAYGVLLAYEGIYEITVKFVALNVNTGERLEGKVRIKIVGATILATDTPELEEPVP